MLLIMPRMRLKRQQYGRADCIAHYRLSRGFARRTPGKLDFLGGRACGGRLPPGLGQLGLFLLLDTPAASPTDVWDAHRHLKK
jgi:hypothetical protein